MLYFLNFYETGLGRPWPGVANLLPIHPEPQIFAPRVELPVNIHMLQSCIVFARTSTASPHPHAVFPRSTRRRCIPYSPRRVPQISTPPSLPFAPHRHRVGSCFGRRRHLYPRNDLYPRIGLPLPPTPQSSAWRLHKRRRGAFIQLSIIHIHNVLLAHTSVLTLHLCRLQLLWHERNLTTCIYNYNGMKNVPKLYWRNLSFFVVQLINKHIIQGSGMHVRDEIRIWWQLTNFGILDGS
jgi:hypothetical protein